MAVPTGLDGAPPDAPQLLELDRAHVWHPYASVIDPAPVYPVASAQGVRITLADGRELVDGVSSWWAAVHGYRVPELDAAARAQLDAMAHVMFGGLTHAPGVELAGLLAELTPGALQHVFFCDSGSVAVEVAVKMALQYWRSQGQPGKTRLLTVRGGYHGDTFATMALCDPVGGMHALFADMLPQHLFAARPDQDPDAADLAALLRRHADEVAALVLEPVVQNAGGMRFYPPSYLSRARELCDRYDVLLIADEIATGFGRTGRMFACEHAGVVPDILCVGKALTGGYLSLAAAVCTPRVAHGICGGEAGVLMHGPTYMANPLATAVARASVELLLSRGWQAEVARIEEELRVGLAPARELPGVADVRVLGAIGVLEMRAPVDVPRVTAHLVDRGVWLRPFRNLIYTMPPYALGRADAALVTAAMVEVAALA
ncbi:MAG: adenosylmethionine--8-amino-7-oxononanoate transaminase [Actinomycetota bacterium]|nr:adenosylmethionine--8-amino-7-oxononanoate transaminase [Actinomycetota bacterium]